jgi:hypothetical protein
MRRFHSCLGDVSSHLVASCGARTFDSVTSISLVMGVLNAQAEEERYGYAYDAMTYDDSDDDPDYGKKTRKKKAQRRHKLEKSQAVKDMSQQTKGQVGAGAPAANGSGPGAINQRVADQHALGQLGGQQNMSTSNTGEVLGVRGETQGGRQLAHASSDGDLGLSATGRRKRKGHGGNENCIESLERRRRI